MSKGRTAFAFAVPALSVLAGLLSLRRRTQLGRGEQLVLPGSRAPSPLSSVVVTVGRKNVPEKLLAYRPPLGFRYQLSRTQLAALFPGIERLPRDVWPQARCGLWGCAYPRGPRGTAGADEVIKFTADKEEALVARKLKGNPVPGVMPVLDVFELPRRKVPRIGQRIPQIFAIRTRRFKTPGKLARVLGGCPKAFAAWQVHKLPGSLYEFIRCVEFRAARHGIDSARAYDAAESVVESVKGLERLGISWADLHSGNVTEDENGNPVIIDVGPYAVDHERMNNNIPGLAGARRRRGAYPATPQVINMAAVRRRGALFRRLRPDSDARSGAEAEFAHLPPGDVRSRAIEAFIDGAGGR